MIRVITALAVYLVSLAASAEGWGQNTRIAGYYVYDTGVAFIRTQNNQNPDNCTNPLYLALHTDSKNFKAIWAQVIAAHASNTTVTLHYSGCFLQYPKITAIAVPFIW